MARRSKYEIAPATLTETLELRTVDELKRYHKLLSDDKARPSRKAELVAGVRSHLRGSRLRALWENFDDIDQAALAEAVHDSMGKFHANRFAAKYGDSPAFSSGDSSRRTYQSTPTILSVFFYNQQIPDDLRAELKSFVPEPAEATLQVCESLPAHHSEARAGLGASEVETSLDVRYMEEAARHDLRAAFGLIEAGKLSVSETSRQPSAASCKALGKVLLGGDFYDDDALESEDQGSYYEPIGSMRGFAWPMLLQAGGVCEASGKRLQLSKTGRKAMTDPPEKTLRRLWQRWLKTTMLDEFRRIDNIKGQTGKGKRGFTALAGRRQSIEFVLQECPVGNWVQVDELFRHMQATGEDFEVTRDPWRLYLCDAHYGSLGYDGHHNWEILQGRYALCMLFEYAATLGVIDVAYIPPHHARSDYADRWGADDMLFLSRYDGLQYLRLTPLGAYCLGMTEQYVATEPEHRKLFWVLPNLDIVGIDDGLDAADQLLLDSYATRSSESVWRLDQTTLLAASEQGRDIAIFRDFLLARSADKLPDEVERLLSDTLERTTLLQDKGSVHLIECADAALATLIASDSRCRKLCLQAGERHLVVYAGSEGRFRKEVRKLGYSLPGH